MASQPEAGSEEGEDFHSLSGDPKEEDGEEETMEPPVHPLPSLQGAFEESIFDSAEEGQESDTSDSATQRRQKLLESPHYDDSWAARWKQKPSAQHHPLVKLVAQIVFGMHLLQQQQAKSDEEVVKILQTHVNEIDTFLERTSEDLDLAIGDIKDRIQYLKLPMAHITVFETMLDDKKFRTQLVEGNDKIEKIIDRTARAMRAALMDVQYGAKANKELGRYLSAVEYQWPKDKPGITDVYGAMHGNEQGWKRYLKDLQTKGSELNHKLTQLGRVIGQLSQLAAAASRRNKTQSKNVSAPATSKSAPSSPGLRSKFSQDSPPVPSLQRNPSNLNKPLPKEPNAMAGAAQNNDPSKKHPVPFEERYESPRQTPQSPDPNRSRISKIPNGVPLRPKTSGSTTTSKEARVTDAKDNQSETTGFLPRSNPLRSNPNPLRSNPPDEYVAMSDGEAPSRKMSSPQSQNTDTMAAGALNPDSAKLTITRSRSQEPLTSPAPIKTADIEQKSDDQRTTPRPVLGKDDRQDSGHRSADSPTPVTATQANAVKSTGFARRLSKRMKHLPANHEPPTALLNAKREQPTDSAYASGTSPQSGVNGTSAATEGDEGKRPESMLGPLPFQQLYDQQRQDSEIRGASSTTSDEWSNYQNNPSYQSSASQNGGVAPSVRSLASTSKSRSTLGIRSFFQKGKWKMAG